MPKIGTILPIFMEKSGVGYPNVVSQHTKDVNIASLDYVRAVFIATMRLQIAEFDQSILLSYHHNLAGGEVANADEVSPGSRSVEADEVALLLLGGP